MKFNYKTVTRKILADLYTPVGVYMRLRDIYPQSALMESSDYHGSENSRSFIGVHPLASIAVSHGEVIKTYPDGRVEKEQLPAFGAGQGEKCKLAISKSINDFISSFHVEGESKEFCGLYGFTTFNAVRYFENIPVKDTTMEKKFIDGCSNTVPNKVLEKLLWENFSQVEMPEYTEEEIAYAQALCDSVEMKDNKLPGDFTEDSEELYEFVDKASEHGTKAINDFLIPYFYSEHPRMGSTDVGDVSWLVPTATYPSKAPGHSWQNVSCGRTSIAHKAMLMAGKVLAAAAVDLMEKPEVLQAARDEYEAKMKRYGDYFCPVPEGAVPVVPGEKM